MRNSTLLIAGGGGAVAIVLVGLVIAVRRDAGSRPRPPQVPVATAAPAAPAPAPTQPPPAPALPVEAAKPIAAATPSRPSDAATIADLDRAHPGIADAYRAGREAAMPDLQRRLQRRCLRRVAPELAAVEWITLETYTLDGSGHAVLSAFDQLQGTPGSQAFLDCIHRDMVGNVTFAVPPGTPSTFTIRETSRVAAERRREPD